MNKLFVPYSLALLAKEKGFDEKCIFSYQDGELQSNFMCGSEATEFVEAPLYQQLLDWFREKYQIDVHVAWDGLANCKNYYSGWINGSNSHSENYDYYEALNEILEEAFKLINL